MIHKDIVENYNGSKEQLAEEIGDLRYDALSNFLGLLSQKIQKDGRKDFERGRVKLAKELFAAAEELKMAEQAIDRAWIICKPFM